MSSMKTPRNRRELERSANILSEKMRQNKMQFSSNVIHTMDSLTNIRFLPNKRINLLTINESARCLLNSISNFDGIKIPESETDDK